MKKIIKSHEIISTIDIIPGRKIDVLLPPDYKDTNKDYPILFLQDGQNCLDHDPFGHGGWQVDKTIYDLIKDNKIEPMITVLIPNMGESGPTTRTMEYTPVIYNGNGGYADEYLTFIAKDIVTFMENNYRVKKGPKYRTIGGSSFGGLLSFYAVWEHSHVFGNGICMSPSFWWGNTWMIRKVRTYKGELPDVKIYIDSGGLVFKRIGNKTICSDDGMVFTEHMRDLLTLKGFKPGINLYHHKEDGHLHNESSWRERFDIPIKFMYKKDKKPQEKKNLLKAYN